MFNEIPVNEVKNQSLNSLQLLSRNEDPLHQRFVVMYLLEISQLLHRALEWRSRNGTLEVGRKVPLPIHSLLRLLRNEEQLAILGLNCVLQQHLHRMQLFWVQY